MAGHYGNEQVTTRNLKIVRIDAEKNMVLVEGAVPGANGGLIRNPSKPAPIRFHTSTAAKNMNGQR